MRLHRSGVKHLHHPVVGDLTLAYESMELTADQGPWLEPGDVVELEVTGLGILRNRIIL